MSSSAQPALKGNLFEALQALSEAPSNGLSGVQVSYGYPKSPAKNFVILGDIIDDGEKSAGYGATSRPRDEKFSLEVIVKVEKQTSDQRLTTELAYTILAAIENALRTDPRVNASVLWALVGGVSLEELANDQTRMAILTVRVQCKARI